MKIYTSNALWPDSVRVDNHISTDTHGTKEQAEAVCKMLRQNGLGGEGRIFPIKTWVEEINS